MDYSSRRRFVSTTTELVMARAEASDSTATPNPTIAPYHTNLNGVDQPVNLLFADMLWWTFGIFGFVLLSLHILELAWVKLRHVSAMNTPGEKQTFWKYSQWSWMPAMKKHLIYAPLWNKRRLREFRLSSAVNMGTLPGRIHTLLLSILLISNIVYMFFLKGWTDSENRWKNLAEVRGRSGTLSAINMLPLIIFAGRNNPLINMLGVSFDTYNLFHRWIGRISIIEAIVHTVAWTIVAHADGGFDLVWDKILHDDFIASGTAGTIAMVLLMLTSFSPVRHAFYETFLNTHIILAIVTFVGTYIHCVTATIPGVGGLPQVTIVIAIFALWFCDRLARMFRMLAYNWSSRGKTEAFIEAMPCEAVRVTMHLPRYLKVNPGSHAYLRFAQCKWWESHPFSIAWVEHHSESSDLPMNEKDLVLPERKVSSTSVSFIIGAQTGMTRTLYNMAASSPTQTLSMRANFEGPYGAHNSFDSYGTAILFAGSTGITHCVQHVKHLLDGYNMGTVATRKITLVWIIRDYEALEWVKPWMNEILRIPNRKQLLKINICITRPKSPSEIASASNSIRIFPGRPDISAMLRREVASSVGATLVTCCGGGSLADSVTDAVRSVQKAGSANVSLDVASFSW